MDFLLNALMMDAPAVLLTKHLILKRAAGIHHRDRGCACRSAASEYGLGLDNVAAGISRSEILACYPSLTPEDIDAALAYAAELVREGSFDLPAELTA